MVCPQRTEALLDRRRSANGRAAVSVSGQAVPRSPLERWAAEEWMNPRTRRTRQAARLQGMSVPLHNLRGRTWIRINSLVAMHRQRLRVDKRRFWQRQLIASPSRPQLSGSQTGNAASRPGLGKTITSVETHTGCRHRSPLRVETRPTTPNRRAQRITFSSCPDHVSRSRRAR